MSHEKAMKEAEIAMRLFGLSAACRVYCQVMTASAPADAKWESTFRATLDIHVAPRLGGMADCKAWAKSVGGREVTVSDVDGVVHVLGIVGGYRVERMP